MKARSQINNLQYLKETRKFLRRNLTPAEASLWRILKSKQLDRKFRRQFSVGNYILDFYCHSEKFAIELDGAHHFTEEGIAKDKERDEFLQRQGINIIRIENKKVFDNTSQVIDLIRNNFKKT